MHSRHFLLLNTCLCAHMLGMVPVASAQEDASERALTLKEDHKLATSQYFSAASSSKVIVGAQFGILPRTWTPSFLRDEDSGSGDRMVDGASTHASRNIWLQLRLPLLLTRGGAALGVDSEHTIGFVRERHLDPRRTLTWSTQWSATLSGNLLAMSAGVRFAQQPRYWWMAESRRALYGAFSVRGKAGLLGYEYRPLLSPLQGEVSIDGLPRGTPNHAEHHLWLDVLVVRVGYVMRRIRFFQEDEPARHTHEIVFTLHTL